MTFSAPEKVVEHKLCQPLSAFSMRHRENYQGLEFKGKAKLL